MAKKSTKVFISKRNSGLEINLEFFYTHHTEVQNVDRMRVEEWWKREVTSMFTRFRMTFPEI